MINNYSILRRLKQGFFVKFLKTLHDLCSVALRLVQPVQFLGTVTKKLHIGTVEGGIVLVAAGGKYLCGFLSLAQHILRRKEPLCADVFANRCAGDLFEPAAKLGTADLKLFTQFLNG